ncbi:BnaC05g30610D [Brassica napus]|uniref:BnaC05g30610D protein n=1 Tax=Brassica napus TaxID=3708 RepID=A0A078I2Q9_BRANA|nr:BnaC05g30610D [Brassica napus]
MDHFDTEVAKTREELCLVMNLQDNVDISNLMRKHISKGSPKQALLLYEAIRRKGVFFPGWIPLLLKACACVPNFVLGKQLHSESIKFGIHSDVMVRTSLIKMYSQSGCIVSARNVFDEMLERNVATWNAMIGGYMWNGDALSATRLFGEIIGSGNEVTWIAWAVMLGGYVSNREMEAARMFFEEIPEKNSFVWSLMISGYFRAGDVDEASGVFNRVKVRDLVIWNSLITGYAQNGYSDGAIDAFYKMQGEGFEPDAVTVSSVLSACAQSCRLDVGREVHSLINRIGIELNEFVSNALIDMYAKCGDLENATSVFESLSVRSVACWNSMISCLAIHGKGGEALEMFRTMDTKPDEITFLAALSACVHGGFLVDGLKIFLEMKNRDVKPNVKHFGCLVHLLGRSGKLKEAYGLVREMPVKPNDTVLGALLGACKVHMDTEMAEQVMKIIETAGSVINGDSENHLVLISNLYAHAESWQTAETLRVEMEKRGLEKSTGLSSLVLT